MAVEERQVQVEPDERAQTRVTLAAPLRVGIMLDGFVTSAWVARILADIQAAPFADLVAVVLNDGPRRPAAKLPFRERLKRYWIHGLYNRYTDWDYRKNRAERDALAPVEVTELVRGGQILKVKPLQKGFVDRFTEDDIARIKATNLDVLFRFGFRIIRGDILNCARYGVWSFHHGDNRQYRGAPPGFWEMYERNPISGTILQILTDDLDGGLVIYRSFSATNFDSLYLNKNAAYWKTSQFAIRRLRDLHRYGWQYIQSLPDYSEPDNYHKPIYKTPRAPVMARFLIRLAARRVRQLGAASLFVSRNQWFVALRRRLATRAVPTDRNGFQTLAMPPGHFYADPFLLRRNGKNYLFFEDFDFRAGKAAIACAELDESGNCGEPQVVLAAGYHLSYPFVFEWSGEVYMIPETRMCNRIELYRAVDFPRRWILEKVILDKVTAVDATLLEHDGKFWLFTNIAADGANVMDELHLFSADSPLGMWQPHPKNPIVSDVRRARPAGALFWEDGQLLRPAQDCSVRYGRAIVLNRVEELSETEYRETPAQRIGPDWKRGNLCTHTYNRNEDFEVLDGMLLRRQLRFAS